MKIVYVNSVTKDVLTSLDIDVINITDEQIKIVESYDKEEITALTIEFNAGVLTEQTHDISNDVKPYMVNKMTISIKK